MGSNFDPNRTVKWCTECHRYFNPEVPHDCVDKGVVQNRAKLEKWLGTYTIKEG